MFVISQFIFKKHIDKCQFGDIIDKRRKYEQKKRYD